MTGPVVDSVLSVRRRLCFWQMYQNKLVLVLYYVRIQLSVSFNGPAVEDDVQVRPNSPQSFNMGKIAQAV